MVLNVLHVGECLVPPSCIHIYKMAEQVSRSVYAPVIS